MFKKIWCLCITLFFAFSFSYSKNTFSISGKISNLKENQKYIFLYQYFGSEAFKIDSAKISKGQFEISGNYINGFYQLGTSQDNATIIVIGKEQNLIFSADATNFMGTAKISGSVENDLFAQFVAVNASYGQSMKQLAGQKNQIAMLAKTDSAKFYLLMNELRMKEDSVLSAQNGFFSKIYSNHKGTFMADFSSIFIISDTTNLNNYITKRELEEETFTVGEMLVGKVNNYFSYYVNKTEADFQKAGQILIEKSKPNSPNRELMYRIVINLFLKVGVKNISDLRKNYAKEFPNSARVKQYLENLPKPLPEIGDIAPEIFLPDTSGNFVKLSQIKAKIIILDFWASWCRPCRAENPNVVKAYNKYKSKGLEIVGISLDDNKNSWKTAIKKDGLVWPQVSDLRGWSSIAGAAYGVQSIPATFILNEKGEILAKNLRGPALEEFLSNYFSK